MKKIIYLLLLIGLFGYLFIQLQGYSFKADSLRLEKSKKIKEYELMKNVLIENLDYITSKYQRDYNHGCSKKLLFSAGNLTYWIGWEKDHPELNKIEKFYDENLFYQINIYENKAVYFESVYRGRKICGDFFHHHIAYEPNENKLDERYIICGLKIKTVKKLKNNWYYIIEKI